MSRLPQTPSATVGPSGRRLVSRLPQTPAATVGPYFSIKLAEHRDMAGPECAGVRIQVEGRVLDGDGQGVEDALIEIWQANAAGRYRHPADNRDELPLDESFTGYGRAYSDFATGAYAFRTLKPGPVPASGSGLQAPHLSLIVTARGLLNHLVTRVYFGDEAAANAADPVLASVPADRRPTLIAEPVAGRDVATYRFDVRLQGRDETVFFDV